MSATTRMARAAARTALAGTAAVVAGYAAYAAVTWLRYGRVANGADPREGDALLDDFIPTYDIVERHRIRVAAPADITLAAAREQDLLHVPLIRAIFKAREIAMGATRRRESR